MNAPANPQRRYTNAVLTAVAALLGLNLFASLGATGPAPAMAQHSADEPMVSAAEQRKVMIAEIRSLSGRIERLEIALARGINVKVVDMPAVRIADGASAPEPRETRRPSRK